MFFQCLGPDREPREWNPPEPIGNLIDTWYFGRALEAMAREVESDRLTVYLTFDTEILPSYGDDVVVILIGDEWARLPAYLPRVRAVFRNLCSRPNLGCRPLAWPSPATLSLPTKSHPWLARPPNSLWVTRIPVSMTYTVTPLPADPGHG